jgi:hypothetical protein
VTSWPAATACLKICRLMPPVAPKTREPHELILACPALAAI